MMIIINIIVLLHILHGEADQDAPDRAGQRALEQVQG